MEQTQVQVAQVGADMKMDKVRRLLANRYGEEAKDAVLTLLDMVVGDYVEVLREAISRGEQDCMTGDQLDLAEKALTDLITRAKSEPKPRKVKEQE